MEYSGKRDAARPRRVGGRGAAMVRDFGAKLRITAAALGCASQKDLCARFHEVNPGTTFELDRSYKWMQGRALPRSVRLYEDWAALLGTGRPLAWLQSCTVEEFLELVCAPFRGEPRGARRAGGHRRRAAPEAAEPEPRDALPGRHLAGIYACYSHAWSPYFEGRIIRSALVIEAARGARRRCLRPTASGSRSAGSRLRGPVSVSGRVDPCRPRDIRPGSGSP